MAMFDFSNLDVPAIYRLMTSAIIPRPIAFVSTCDPNGVGNLAPFSYFNAVSSAPPCISICFTPKRDGSKKDTLRNLEATRELVVHIATETMAEAVNQSSAEYAYGVDEAEALGLKMLSSDFVRPRRLADAPVAMECTLLHVVSVGDGRPGSSVLVIAQVRCMHVEDSFLRSNTVIAEALRPLARLGGNQFSTLGSVTELARPRN